MTVGLAKQTFLRHKVTLTSLPPFSTKFMLFLGFLWLNKICGEVYETTCFISIFMQVVSLKQRLHAFIWSSKYFPILQTLKQPGNCLIGCLENVPLHFLFTLYTAESQAIVNTYSQRNSVMALLLLFFFVLSFRTSPHFSFTWVDNLAPLPATGATTSDWAQRK